MLRDKEGCEKMWPVASIRMLKTGHVASVSPVACTGCPSVYTSLFSKEKKSEYYYPLHIV